MNIGERAAQLTWLNLHNIEYEVVLDDTTLNANELDKLIRMADYMGGECEWFALCTEPAERWRTHPVLGVVPVCEQHYSWEGK